MDPVRITSYNVCYTKLLRPSVHKIWQYTIAYMAPDGQMIRQGEELLRFDTEELITGIREKSNALNEKEKELQKQQILAREQLAELRLHRITSYNVCYTKLLRVL